MKFGTGKRGTFGHAAMLGGTLMAILRYSDHVHVANTLQYPNHRVVELSLTGNLHPPSVAALFPKPCYLIPPRRFPAPSLNLKLLQYHTNFL